MRPAFVLASAILALAAASRAASAQEKSDVASKVRTILLGIREDEPISSEILAKRLVNLGSATTPMLLEALESGFVPLAPGAQPGTAPEPMDELRRAAAFRALSTRSRGELVQPATRLLEGATSVRATVLAVGLLGSIGDRRELALLCRTARPRAGEIVDGELTDAFELAVKRILERDPNAPATAHALLRAEPESVRWSMIRALASCGTESALSVLATELGVHPEDDAFLLEQMAQASAALSTPIPESIRLSVRPYLRNGTPPSVGKAARCLAAMQDTDSVEELVGLLRDGDPAVLREVHAALSTLTNVRLLPDAARWERWFEQERIWFRDEFPVLCEDLQRASGVVAVQAISKMAAHPMHRREIAEVLTRSLEHEPASIRRMACSALRQLGAKSAVPSLERWAEDTNPELAVEARRALSALGSPRREPQSAASAGEPQGDPGSSR